MNTVYSGNSKALGNLWTTIDPSSVENYRDAVGLPNGNTGRFVIEGTVNPRDITLERSALRLDGNSGGLRDLVIDPTKVNIERVSGVNPEY